jgi:hypothetical protein
VRSIGFAAFAAATVALCGLAWAQDSGPGAANAHAAPAGERASDVWTPEAMTAAAPVALPEIDPAAVHAFAGHRAAEGLPRQDEPQDIAAAGGSGNQRSSGNIYKTPLHWSGALFSTSPSGGGEKCSAQFISNDVVVTAAHCVRDAVTGAYNRNIAFALEYQKGRYSQLYRSTCAWTYDSWVSSDPSHYLYDYAFIRVDRRSATGHWGAYWNWAGAYDTATKTGYPVGIAGGQIIQVNTGPVSVTNGIVRLDHGGTADLHGSSGGAWIGGYSGRLGHNNYIISVQSFVHTGDYGTSYGPYLDTTAKKLLASAEGPCS